MEYAFAKFLPVFSAARAIADRPALILSAYCSGIRVDFQPPACVIAVRSMSSAARSCVAPTRVECPLTHVDVFWISFKVRAVFA
jgi:hypothetical protein